MTAGTTPPGDGAASPDPPEPAGQDASGNKVGNDLYMVSGVGGDVTIHPPADRGPGAPGSRSSRPSPLLVGGAFFAALIVVVAAALYVRDHWRPGSGGADPGRTAGAGATGAPGTAATSPQAVTKPLVKPVSDMNPLKLGTQDLVELYGRNQDWLIPHPAKVVGRPPDTGERPAMGFYRFVQQRNGIAVNHLFFNTTIQNVTKGAVYLRSMRVTDLHYGPPLKGTRLWSGGGADPLSPKAVLLDLDSPGPRPLLFAKVNEQWIGPADRPAPDARQARNFGFTLPASGTESFDIVALETRHRSCEFTLTIEAVLNGESQQIKIDDHGRPFRVTGDPDNVYWMFDSPDPARTWRRPAQADDGSDARFASATDPLTETDS